MKWSIKVKNSLKALFSAVIIAVVANLLTIWLLDLWPVIALAVTEKVDLPTVIIGANVIK